MIRTAKTHDFPAILSLNSDSVDFLSPLTRERLENLHAQAACHRVIEIDRQIVAFLLAFREGADYDSPNYAWFSRHYPAFCYIDRAVVHAAHRRKGHGAALYRDIFDFTTRTGVTAITCEIDRIPPNPASLLFHEQYGFEEVGTQWINGGKKQVSLRRKLLPPSPA